MRCSVVIRAYNEAEHLPRLLEGIRQQTIKDVEVIVVDSGSSDLTMSIAEGHGARVVHMQPEDFSFGRSLKTGIREATREYVVIASAHVYPVYPDWLEFLLKSLEERQVAVSYGKQRGAESTLFSERQVFQQWYPESGVMNQPSPFCNNANAAIKRSLWEKHAYDEKLPGLEDIAWARWAMNEGFQVAYTPQAEVVHIHVETHRLVYDRYRREGMAFKQIFPEAHFNVYDFVRLSITNILNDLQHVASKSRPWRFYWSFFRFRILQFWGTYQGYRQSGPVTKHLRQTLYYPNGCEPFAARERSIKPITYKQ